eukprot:g5753.t1
MPTSSNFTSASSSNYGNWKEVNGGVGEEKGYSSSYNGLENEWRPLLSSYAKRKDWDIGAQMARLQSNDDGKSANNGCPPNASDILSGLCDQYSSLYEQHTSAFSSLSAKSMNQLHVIKEQIIDVCQREKKFRRQRELLQVEMSRYPPGRALSDVPQNELCERFATLIAKLRPLDVSKGKVPLHAASRKPYHFLSDRTGNFDNHDQTISSRSKTRHVWDECQNMLETTFDKVSSSKRTRTSTSGAQFSSPSSGNKWNVGKKRHDKWNRLSSAANSEKHLPNSTPPPFVH